MHVPVLSEMEPTSDYIIGYLSYIVNCPPQILPHLFHVNYVDADQIDVNQVDVNRVDVNQIDVYQVDANQIDANRVD